MGKRRNRNRTARRDVSYITSPRLIEPISFDHLRLSSLEPIEDRRTFHPEQALRPARSFSRATHALEVSRSPASRRAHLPPSRVVFEDANRVLVCVRRKRRREVVFAMGKAGKGQHRRAPRRSYFSDIGC